MPCKLSVGLSRAVPFSLLYDWTRVTRVILVQFRKLTVVDSTQLEAVIDMLLPAMEGTRQRRKYIENEWLLSYRAYQGWPSAANVQVLPDNSIRYFIPHLRRAVERNVKRGTKLLMPNMDWHQTLPFDGRSHENAEAVHNTLRYIYQKKIPTKRNISSGLRCLQLYNFAILHTSAIMQNHEVWPYQKAVDPFNFYVFPDTATNVEEATILFEDSIIPYEVYNSYVDRDDKSKSLYEYIKAEDLQTPQWPYHLIERIAYRGLSQPSDFIQGTGNTRTLRERDIKKARDSTRETLSIKSKTFVQLSKVYFRLGSEWFFTVICTNISGGGDNKYNAKIVRLDDTENRPLYRWSNTRPLPGELYTSSPADDIRTLQNLTNNALSQVESNRSRTAEPPIGMDANQVGRLEMKTFGNRQIWLLDGNPNDIIKSIDVNDTSSKGIQHVQIYKGMLDQNSGGGLPEGQPGRNMPRAGFAANTFLNMSLTDMEDEADTYEQDCLTPGLGDAYHIMIEYVPDSQLIKIPNKNPNLIKAYKKRDLTGDYSFTWLGSLGFQDTQVRAEKFMQFLSTLLNPQVFPLVQQQLAQQKKKLDLLNIFQTIYSYGLGERGLGDLVIDMTPEELQQMNQPSPEQQMQQQVMQQSQREADQKMQLQQAKGQTDMQKSKLDLAKMQMELQKTSAEHQMDLQSKQMDMRHKMLTAMIPGGGQNNGNSQQK